jgi:hypothetical protein
MDKMSLKDFFTKANVMPVSEKLGTGALLKEMSNFAVPSTSSSSAMLQSVRANQGQGRFMKMHRVGGAPAEVEEEQELKIDQARNIFNSMARNPNVERQQIIDKMMQHAGVTHSTAVSYYERLAKEAGLTNQGGDDEDDNPMQAAVSDDTAGMPTADVGEVPAQNAMDFAADGGSVEQGPQVQPEVQNTIPDDANKQGIIRHVDKAHLVFKRQTPDGTFEELWSYNISTDMKDELSIRRKILAGTDIPSQKTTSPDGSQAYTLTTMGNGQLLHITGLSQ